MKFIGTACLIALAVANAFGQVDTKRKALWQPNRRVADQNISLVAWGSGTISEDTDVYDLGSFSLRVSTHNYFQGGFLRFNTPADLTQSYGDPSSLLALSIRTAD